MNAEKWIQLDLRFDSATGVGFDEPSTPMSALREEWRKARADQSYSLGMPLGKCVEVRLRQGPVLRGIVSQEGDTAGRDSRFEIEGTIFTLADVESLITASP